MKSRRGTRTNQPHAKQVTAIDAMTLEFGKTYRSTKAAEEDGFCRENIRTAIRTLGVHKGFFWCYAGNEIGAIRVIKKKILSGKKQNLQKKEKGEYQKDC